MRDSVVARTFALSLITLLSAASARADALESKADVFVRRATTVSHTGRIRLIVRTRTPVTPSQRARIAALGGSIYRNLPIVQSVALDLPRRHVLRLAALPFVVRLSGDVAVRRTALEPQTGQRAGGGSGYRSLLAGGGPDVGIAILDSGIADHPDFRLDGVSRIRASISFVPGDSSTGDPCGHGSHVAGVAAGNGAASTGPDYFRTFTGVAPTASLINVRVLDSRGSGSVSGAIAGIQWVVDNAAVHNIRVLNVSLGHDVGESYGTDPLCQAAEAAWKAGIVVVCAAGNSGRLYATQSGGAENEGWGTAYGSIQSPGNDPYVITVGAMKQVDGNRANDRIATYSSRGPSRVDLILKPDLVAPGNRLISVMADDKAYLPKTYRATNQVPTSTYQYANKSRPSGYYFYLSGTSIAAPAVSGAAALLIQSDLTLTPDTVKIRLMSSADKWTFPDGTPDACTFGAGYLNIPAALASRAVARTSSLSPTVALDPARGLAWLPNALVGQPVWGSDIVNLQSVWGTGTRQAIWGTDSIWSLYSRQAIWGTQSIWGNQAIWGNSVNAVDLTATAIYGEK